MRRDSFETLDVDDLEYLRDSAVPREAVTEESGLRRLSSPDEPRGLWSEVPAGSASPSAVASRGALARLPGPPPLPKKRPFAAFSDVLAQAPEHDPDDTGSYLRPVGLDAGEPERVDMDELVETLSERPAPLAVAPPALAFPPIAPLALPPMVVPAAPAPGRGLRVAGVAVAVAVVAYLAGVGTTTLLSRDAQPSVESVETVDSGELAVTAARAEAAVDRRAPIEEQSVDMDAAPAVRAPIQVPVIEIATPARAPSAPRVAARPVVRAASAPRPVAESTPARPTRAVAGLPATPDRAAIQTAMDTIRDDVRACGDDARGYVARVRFTFGGEGRPLHASVSGVSGPAASCVARAARTARIAPFAEERFVVEYPFTL